MILFVIALGIVGNGLFYEYRVLKGVGKPKTFNFTGYKWKRSDS